ncbi:hypothetical protein L211DRAFT_852306 [Terfezia boudieri ATCC MYA-4762]|uniref:Uncharacterized protein n=1 Tax=Terfezia boudieri ATCC MYA-4762 TaxID=1051890 RepID=A0A3N4LC61_9PEZI|nr:hypothetical protein L211DRAFT_852306 [Terfezia boudieri ATCC MYA-4762]
MVASREQMDKQQGFHPHPARNNPEIPNADKHQLGVKASPYDHIPESHAKILPPGTAPPEFTFHPHNDYNVLAGESRQLADPLDFPGAPTSKDLDSGFGKPVQGMSAKELQHDGQPVRKKQELGLAKHAAYKMSRGGADLEHADPRVDPKQRALEKDVRSQSA